MTEDAGSQEDRRRKRAAYPTRLRTLHAEEREDDAGYIAVSAGVRPIDLIWRLTVEAWEFKGEAVGASCVHRHIVALNAGGAEYLLIGAYALAVHGLLRGTGALDLWVGPDEENLQLVQAAIEIPEPSLERLSEQDRLSPGAVVQIGAPPQCLTLRTSIHGVEFEDAWTRRVLHAEADLVVPVLSASDLIRNKLATGRPQDGVDVGRLRECLRRSLKG